MRRVMLAIASCTMLLLCSLPLLLRAQPSSPTIVSMVIDGGYAVILGKQGNVTIGAFTAPQDAHGDVAHRMMLRLTRGTFVKNKSKQPTTTFPLPTVWDLTGLDVEPASYGQATGAVLLPSSTAPAPDCAGAPNGQTQGDEANALALFPNITALGKSTVDTNLSRYTSRVLFAHGRLVLTRAMGCWEYKKGAETVMPKRQRLAAGMHAIKYDLRMPGDTFELKLTKIGGGTPESIVVKPEWFDDNHAWEVAFWVGRFPEQAEELAVNTPMKHFDRYYSLLTSPPESKDRILPVKRHTNSPTAPGDECSPAVYIEQ